MYACTQRQIAACEFHLKLVSDEIHVNFLSCEFHLTMSYDFDRYKTFYLILVNKHRIGLRESSRSVKTYFEHRLINRYFIINSAPHPIISEILMME